MRGRHVIGGITNLSDRNRPRTPTRVAPSPSTLPNPSLTVAARYARVQKPSLVPASALAALAARRARSMAQSSSQARARMGVEPRCHLLHSHRRVCTWEWLHTHTPLQGWGILSGALRHPSHATAFATTTDD